MPQRAFMLGAPGPALMRQSSSWSASAAAGRMANRAMNRDKARAGAAAELCMRCSGRETARYLGQAGANSKECATRIDQLLTNDRTLRCHRDWRRTRRNGSLTGVRARGCAYPINHAEHRNARADELQPGNRRHRQGTSHERDRCDGWRDGAGDRSRRHPVSHAELQQGTRRTRDARSGGPADSIATLCAA